ncbi:MAG: hypothetical protein OEV41_05590 [Gammaproteobacteria bacterium]|jgi:hypothetical protein|nr:hypothetical protein [Gammaproteobacteria bacterium]MDH5344735.1 hypothetical protein [Gammaproteobacteria bacterium]
MKTSDRLWATVLAVVAWLIAGYAVASRPVALQAITPPALDAHPAVAIPRTGHP